MLEYVTANAAGLTALAAIFAVVVGPWIQARGAVRQGRSGAFGQLVTDTIRLSAQDIASFIGLGAQVRRARADARPAIITELYMAKLRAKLSVGSDRVDAEVVCQKLDALEQLFVNEATSASEIETAVTGVQVAFDRFKASERRAIVSA